MFFPLFSVNIDRYMIIVKFLSSYTLTLIYCLMHVLGLNLISMKVFDLETARDLITLIKPIVEDINLKRGGATRLSCKA